MYIIGYDKTAASTFPPAVDSHNRVANEIHRRIDIESIESKSKDCKAMREKREGTNEINGVVIRETNQKEERRSRGAKESRKNNTKNERRG